MKNSPIITLLFPDFLVHIIRASLHFPNFHMIMKKHDRSPANINVMHFLNNLDL